MVTTGYDSVVQEVLEEGKTKRQSAGEPGTS
jgi:hypothetical protein